LERGQFSAGVDTTGDVLERIAAKALMVDELTQSKAKDNEAS